jgi:hypothetical protein
MSENSSAAAHYITSRFETIERPTGATLLDDEAVGAESGLDVGALDGAASLI